jgi:hypothetical protein
MVTDAGVKMANLGTSLGCAPTGDSRDRCTNVAQIARGTLPDEQFQARQAELAQ